MLQNLAQRRQFSAFLQQGERQLSLLDTKGFWNRILKVDPHLRSITSLVSLRDGQQHVELKRGPNWPCSHLKSEVPMIFRISRKYRLFSIIKQFSNRTGLECGHLAKESDMASNMGKTTLENLTFDNKAMRDLPVDESLDPRVQRQVYGACFTNAHQEPLENPITVAVSLSALDLLDISESEAAKSEFAEYFSGSKLIPGSKPAAHCYCGHQFGYFSGQLGDGAAM